MSTETFSPDIRAWAQLVVRRYAAATNLLIPGQLFVLAVPHGGRADEERRADALEDLLHRWGARTRRVLLTSSPASPGEALPAFPRARALIDISGAYEVSPESSGTVTVLASSASCADIRVYAPSGAQLHDPHSSTPDDAPTRLAWARTHMPVTREAVAALKETGLLAGRRIGLSLVLEPKTAVLAAELAEAGAQVAVFGHPEETRDDIAAELRERGLGVFAESTADAAREEELARAFLAERFHVLLDDGSHLIRMAHDETRAPGALSDMIGAAEETTSGLRPLAQWVANGPGTGVGHLAIPVMASNDARSKTLFDNAYGTGQSCLLTVMDLVDPEGRGIPLWDQRVVVIGYGDVGWGFARLARACGARVNVAEHDPVRALRARMDGFDVGEALELARECDWMVSATGMRDTVSADLLEAMPDGSLVAVAGGVEQEVAMDEAVSRGASWEADPRRDVDILRMPSGNRVFVMDHGECINVTAGEGNPIEIMDLSFGVQVASLTRLLRDGEDLAPGLHALDREADDAVSALALRCWGQ